MNYYISFLAKTLFIFITINTLTAQNIKFPDANLKTTLLNHTPIIDTNKDGEIDVKEAKALKGVLRIQGHNIADLKGIESFKNVDTLYAGYNDLITVNLNKMSWLLQLDLENNGNLVTLDIRGLHALKYLNLNHCTSLVMKDFNQNYQLDDLLLFDISDQVDTLDITRLTSLNRLYCQSMNGLEHIKLPKTSSLINLDISKTKIINFDFSNLLILKYFTCRATPLKEIDLSANEEVNQIWGGDMPEIMSLNVMSGKSDRIEVIDFLNTPKLNNICVDDIDYAQNNIEWKKDSHVEYTSDCTISSEDILSDIITLYPVPAFDWFRISNSTYGNDQVRIYIYNQNGKLVIQHKCKIDTTINIMSLKSGLYFVEIVSSTGHVVRKKLVKSA